MWTVFVVMVCSAVAAPFIAFAWAMKREQCPHCGASIEPNPALVRMFTGQGEDRPSPGAAEPT
jgi:hypothetical protein